MRRLAIYPLLLVSGFFRALAPRACRFHPSCSRYAVEAFGRLRFFTAARLTALRILRCQPFSNGGYDPLPPIPPSSRRKAPAVPVIRRGEGMTRQEL